MKNNTQKLTTLYIVRHGETEWNVKGLLQGHGDSPLTAKGLKQAHDLKNKLKHIHFDEVFSSDLTRAKHTAEIITLKKKLTIKATQMLRETAFGKFEGKPYHKINTASKKLFDQHKHLSEEERFRLKLAPDLESSEEAAMRFITFLREIAVDSQGKTVLVVTHSGMMRHLLIHLGFVDHKVIPADAISHAALVRIQSDGVNFFIKETCGIKKLTL